jgi:hypothetical protein
MTPNPTPRPTRRATPWVVGLLLLGGIAVLFVVLRQGQAVSAEVGDCLEQTGDDSLTVVACDAPTAEFTVLGKLEGTTSIQAGLFACSDFPATTTSYWEGKEGVGELGTVLCLGPAGG